MEESVRVTVSVQIRNMCGNYSMYLLFSLTVWVEYRSQYTCSPKVNLAVNALLRM